MHMIMVTPAPGEDGKIRKPIAVGVSSIKRIEDVSFIPEAIKIVEPKDAPKVEGKSVESMSGHAPMPLPMVVQSAIVFTDGEVWKVTESIEVLISKIA